MVCKKCHREFEPKKRGRKNTGFCCKKCADNYRYHHKEPKYEKTCECCGAVFKTKHKNQLYCSYACASKTKIKHFSRDINCKCCGKKIVATSPYQVYCAACSVQVKNRKHQERKRFRRQKTHDYRNTKLSLVRIYAQEHGVCSICGLPVPFDNSAENIWGATRDHIIAVSKGGDHTYANCQLAHRICNSLKATEGEKFHIDWREKLNEEPKRWESHLENLNKQIQDELSIENVCFH